MSLIVKKAAKGNKTALTALYENNKKMIYFLCYSLLNQPQAAKQALPAIFEGFWTSLPEQDLSAVSPRSFLMQSAASYCQQLLLSENPDAFSESTSAAPVQPVRPHIHEGDSAELLYLTYLLSKLTPLQRFILVLKFGAGLTTAEVAGLLQITEVTVNVTMNQAEDTLTQAFHSLKNQADCPVHSYLELKALLAHMAAHIPVPSDVEAQVYQHILQIAAPISRKTAALGYLLAAVLLVVCLYPLAAHTFDFFQHTYASIEIENYGTIVVQLDETAAHETTANFIELADSGFYDGLTFHRIISGFMMQGGDPNGNGTGGSGKNITGEFAANGFDNPISHTRGVISMARAQDYNSASSQFFIMHADYPDLDGNYAAFGHVISGMDVVDAICASTPVMDANGSVPSDYQPVIQSISIQRY